MSATEHQLIARAQTGDTEAFCQLAKSHQRRIYLLALHYCRHPQDAEDLSQEVWLRAYRAISRFRGEANFHTWLRQITINAFLNHQREQSLRTGDERKMIRMEELDAVDSVAQQNGGHARAPEMEDGLHTKMLVARVMEALGELTPQQRLMFLLKHREGMTYEEISEALNCSTGTIKKALFRAVVKLRQRLGVGQDEQDYATLTAGEKS